MKNAIKFMDSLVGPTTIGMLIRAYRTNNDLTQSQLAKKLKVTKSYISDIENERKLPALAKVIEIAETLKDAVKLYIRVWTEQTYSEAGFQFVDIVDVRPLSKSIAQKSQVTKTTKKRSHRSLL